MFEDEKRYAKHLSQEKLLLEFIGQPEPGDLHVMKAIVHLLCQHNLYTLFPFQLPHCFKSSEEEISSIIRGVKILNKTAET